ncbi:MAG: M28 family peptidase, partial [Planctomycetota bacterium]
SGTSALLEIARAMAQKRDTLGRSVLFLAFTGEERGLIGSRHFVANPTVPRENIAAMINLDMVGRYDDKLLFVGGVATSPTFRALLKPRVEATGLKHEFGDGGMAPSDNTSFYTAGIPVLFFFTGTHDDYHRPSDDIEKIDLAGLSKVTSLAESMAVAICNLDERPKFTRADRGGFGPKRAVMGIQIALTEGGVGIARVVPDGPAAKAGVQHGDVVMEIDGKKTPDLRALRRALRNKKIGDELTVKLLRGTETIELKVKLGAG